MSEDESSRVGPGSEVGSMSSEEVEKDSDVSNDPEVVRLIADEGPSSASVERITAMNSALQSMSRQNSEIAKAVIKMTQIPLPNFDIANLYPASILAATEAAKLAAEISAFSVNPAFIKMASALTETTQWLAHLYPDLDESLFEITREVLPENWNKDIDFDNLETLIYRDGIPVVWVPSGDVLVELLEQGERDSRVQILLQHSNAILNDCLRVLDEVTRERLLDQRELAIRAIGAWREHPEAAQALAVVLADTLIMNWVKDETLSDYSKIKEGVKQDLDDVPFRNLRKVCAVAVIHTFLETWNPNSNASLPISLSRHATIHGADPAHIHAANSMVAILLVTSLLRTFQDAS